MNEEFLTAKNTSLFNYLPSTSSFFPFFGLLLIFLSLFFSLSSFSFCRFLFLYSCALADTWMLAAWREKSCNSKQLPRTKTWKKCRNSASAAWLWRRPPSRGEMPCQRSWLPKITPHAEAVRERDRARYSKRTCTRKRSRDRQEGEGAVLEAEINRARGNERRDVFFFLLLLLLVACVRTQPSTFFLLSKITPLSLYSHAGAPRPSSKALKIPKSAVEAAQAAGGSSGRGGGKDTGKVRRYDFPKDKNWPKKTRWFYLHAHWLSPYFSLLLASILHSFF